MRCQDRHGWNLQDRVVEDDSDFGDRGWVVMVVMMGVG